MNELEEAMYIAQEMTRNNMFSLNIISSEDQVKVLFYGGATTKFKFWWRVSWSTAIVGVLPLTEQTYPSYEDLCEMGNICQCFKDKVLCYLKREPPEARKIKTEKCPTDCRYRLSVGVVNEVKVDINKAFDKTAP